MRVLVALLLCAGFGVVGAEQTAGVPNGGPVTHFVNGYWFDETRFVKTDFYAEGAYLTKHPDERRSYAEVDLHGGYVVPPYGDAHEHNFDGVYGTAAVVQQYLRDGIFYAQGMTDTTEGAAAVVKAGMVNTPSTVDVTYAHGGLTGVNGHPKEVYESLALGGYGYPRDDKERAAVIASHAREGLAYWEIPDATALEAKWPKILASKPDLIKVYLAGDDFRQATAADPQLARGIDPALVPLITAKAHAAGLKVAAHIDTAHDFHVAVTGGVDELGHLPGYGLSASEDAAKYRLADADIALAAKQHLKLQATAELAAEGSPSAADLAARRALQTENLKRLKAAGVVVLVGSDRYSSDSLKEADYLQGLGVWTNLEMLRMWAVETPQAIFPRRKVGELKPGYEASFVVLQENPLEKWASVHEIVGRWKQGQALTAAAR
jgi:cytosine/adenosine deaminase-related metal-dependent hydrolase